MIKSKSIKSRLSTVSVVSVVREKKKKDFSIFELPVFGH